jgi:hypothetical protein
MADDDRQLLSPDEIAARVRVVETVIRDIENVADAKGNMPVPAAYRLIDKWNRSIKYGDKDVLELGQALDVSEDWFAHLLKKGKAARAWPIYAAIGACFIAITYVGRSDIVLASCAVVMLSAAAFVGHRFGRREGFAEGMSGGYAAAVFHMHGIDPASEKEFWDNHHQALGDKNIADLHETVESSRLT